MSSIIILIIISAVISFSAFFIFSRLRSSRTGLIIAGAAFSALAGISIFMARAAVLFLLLFIVFLIVYYIYRNRAHKKRLVITIASITAAILILPALLSINEKNRLPVMMKADKTFIMNVNETKNDFGTTIRLNKALMDLKRISASYSVKGEEKVVGIELKKDPGDENPLKAMPGLWIGGKLFYENSSFSMPYDDDIFLENIHVLFYLSNGESIDFQLRDTKGVKNQVEVIPLNKNLKYGDMDVKLHSFYRGLNYSWVTFNSSANPDSLEVKLIADGIASKNGSSSWAGGGSGFTSECSFDPVASGEKIQLKIKDTSSGKEDTIDIK